MAQPGASPTFWPSTITLELSLSADGTSNPLGLGYLGVVGVGPFRIGCLDVVGARIGQRWLPGQVVKVAVVHRGRGRHCRCECWLRAMMAEGLENDEAPAGFTSQTRRWRELDLAR